MKNRIDLLVRLAISVAVVSVMLTGYGNRKAYAGNCTSSGAGIYSCSGAANNVTDTTQSATTSNPLFSTSAGFGIDTTSTGGNAITITSSFGNLDFVDNNSSAISGTVDGINTQNNGSSGLSRNLTSGTITGGEDGLDLTHYGSGVLTVITTATISGGTGYGIKTTTGTGRTTNITLNSSAAVSSANGLAIYNDIGDSTTIVNTGAAVSGAIVLNDGNDNLTFAGGNFSGVTLFDGGGDVSAAIDSQIDTLSFIDSSGSLKGSIVKNWEKIVIENSTISNADSSTLATGSETDLGLFINDGGTFEAGTEFNMSGNLTINSGGIFNGTGSSPSSAIISGDVSNSGVMTMQDNETNDSITITGDYVGTGGVLNIDTVLGDGTSATDKLTIGNNSTGSTTVNINNVGGTGAVTGTGSTDGILVVQVDGADSSGTFAVANGGIGVNGFLYNLVQADGQSWYLQSTGLVPQSEGYRVLPSIFNSNIDSLHERVGHREDPTSHIFNTKAGPVKTGRDYGSTDAWVRIVGSIRDISPDNYASFTDDRFFLQTGLDMTASEDKFGKWLLGVNGIIGRSDTEVKDVAGSHVADIDSGFYGLGLTATWYDNNSFYMDFVAQQTYYDADFTAPRINSNIDGENLSLSAELGKRYHPWGYRSDLSIVPQAQIIWSDSDFNSFTDADGATVSMGNGETLTGRLGLMLESSTTDVDQNKTTSYLSTNLYLNLGDDTSVNVSGNSLDYPEHDGWLEIGAGGTVNVGESVDLYGKVGLSTSINDFGDSNKVKGELGLRAWW